MHTSVPPQGKAKEEQVFIELSPGSEFERAVTQAAVTGLSWNIWAQIGHFENDFMSFSPSLLASSSPVHREWWRENVFFPGLSKLPCDPKKQPTTGPAPGNCSWWHPRTSQPLLPAFPPEFPTQLASLDPFTPEPSGLASSTSWTLDFPTWFLAAL